MPKKTPLYDQHCQLHANMVDFHGWLLPLHYGSQLAEHQAVRQHAGMFDVSHMTVLHLSGVDSRIFLRQLLANDVNKLIKPGMALYSCMLNQEGGILDDLIVYYDGEDRYRLVLNAATREQNLAWIKNQSSIFSVQVHEPTNLAMIAVQGPQAQHHLLQVFNTEVMDSIKALRPFEAVSLQEYYIARTGYTGEEGYEIIMPASRVTACWQALLDAGCAPCGLGARDSLRLEAGLLLSGQDMNGAVSPLECGLKWTVAWEPSDRLFVGREALTSQLEQGIPHRLVGLVLKDKGIMRSGYSVHCADTALPGVITSGGFSPTLQCSIALARIPYASQVQEVMVDIRKQQIAARIVKPRFVKQGQALI